MINIDEGNLKEGLLGLVMALVEIIRDALQGQVLRRMENESLSEEEVNRLGETLMQLEAAIESIKEEHGLRDAVRSVRDGLDDVVDDVVNRMLNPERWAENERVQH